MLDEKRGVHRAQADSTLAIRTRLRWERSSYLTTQCKALIAHELIVHGLTNLMGSAMRLHNRHAPAVHVTLDAMPATRTWGAARACAVEQRMPAQSPLDCNNAIATSLTLRVLYQ